MELSPRSCRAAAGWVPPPCHCAPPTHTAFIAKLIAAAAKFPSERISANCVRRSILVGNHDLHFPALATKVQTPIFGVGAQSKPSVLRGAVRSGGCAPCWVWGCRCCCSWQCSASSRHRSAELWVSCSQHCPSFTPLNSSVRSAV